MTKTTGQRIVEEWREDFDSAEDLSEGAVLDLSRRIDEALATAEGEVERLREALTLIQSVNDLADEWAITSNPVPTHSEQAYRWATDLDRIGDLAREALAKKEG